MDLHPPALINKQVTEDMLHWMMVQPNTVTINTVANKFTVTPAKGAEDYPITPILRHVMARELMAILAFNGFESELGKDQLKVSKGLWSMEVPVILDQMPFPDYLPHQINKAYECWKYEQDNLDRAMSYERGEFDYRLYEAHLTGYNLEGISRIVEDSIDDTNKD